MASISSIDNMDSASPRLLVAIAKAAASETIGQVVDESLKRAAENRKLREEADVQRREQERRDERLRQSEEAERASAEELTANQRRAAAAIVSRDEQERGVLEAAEVPRVIERFLTGVDATA